MSETVRLTLDVDPNWITKLITIDKTSQLAFEPDTCSIEAV